MKKKYQLTIITILLILSYKVGFFIYAQDNISLPDYTSELQNLETNYDNILDYRETTRCIATKDDETKTCTASEPVITYIYNSKIATDENVISKNTVRIDNSTLKIYSADTFYADPDIGWTLIETGYIIPTEFDKLQAEKTTRLTNPFKIYSVNAQVMYANSGDGRVYASNANFATARALTTGTKDDSSASISWGTSNGYNIRRGFLPFTFYGVISDCIASATLLIYPNTKNNTGSRTWYATDATPANANSLVNEDFDQLIFTEWGHLNENLVAGRYNAIPLNGTATSSFNMDGSDWIGVTDSKDFENTAPADDLNYAISMSETAGTTQDPYLLVETVEDCDPGEEEETATTTIDVEELNYSDDLTIISGITKHYESSTTEPDWIELTYYHVPFFLWIIIWVITAFIGTRIILELVIRMRN